MLLEHGLLVEIIILPISCRDVTQRVSAILIWLTAKEFVPRIMCVDPLVILSVVSLNAVAKGKHSSGPFRFLELDSHLLMKIMLSWNRVAFEKLRELVEYRRFLLEIGIRFLSCAICI